MADSDTRGAAGGAAPEDMDWADLPDVEAEDGPALDVLDQALDRVAGGPGVAALAAHARRVAADPGEPGSARRNPYAEINRPVVREQVNRARWADPQPGETARWYVRVPGTAVTWDARDLARSGAARMDVRWFATAEEADAFAQDLWRAHWRDPRTPADVRPAADAVVVVRRERFFTLDPARVTTAQEQQVLQAVRAGAAPDLEPGVVLHVRAGTAPDLLAAGDLAGARPGGLADDPLEPVRQRWLADRVGAGAARLPAWDPDGPPTPEGLAAAARWIEAGRDLVRGARATGVPLAARQPYEAALTAAVQALVPPDGSPAAHPDFVRVALERAVTAAAAVPGMAGITRQWADAAEGLTAERFRLFAHGREPDELAAALAGDGPPLATRPDLLALLEQREVFGTRLPSGGYLVWTAEPPIGTTARAETPDVYQPSLAQRPEPRTVGVRVYPTFAAVQDLAARRGATAVALDHPQAIRLWQERVRAVDPTHADAIIARALTPQAVTVTPPPDPDPAPAPRSAPPPVWHLAPWGHGRAVLFQPGAGETPNRLAALQPDGTLAPWAPGAGGPVVVEGAGGFRALAARAAERWPGVTPAEMPPDLARQLVTQHGLLPAEPVLPDDVIWHVTARADRPAAYAWTYVPTVQSGSERPRVRLEPAPLAVGRDLWRMTGPTSDAAQTAGLARLAGDGLLAVADRTTPAAVARRVYAQDVVDLPDRFGVRPADPFAAVAALPREAQETALAALPERLRAATTMGMFGLEPTHYAAYHGVSPGHAAALFREAEKRLGDWYLAHPELPLPPDDALVTAPRPAAPRLAP